MVASLYLPFGYYVNVSVLFLFFTLPCDGLQCLVVALPCHTHLLNTVRN